MKLETDDNIEFFVDDTTAIGKLPNAGIKITIIICIVVILGIGIFLFVRYKKLSSYIK